MSNETANKQTAEKLILDPDLKSPRAGEFEDKLLGQIVGQERAVRRMSGLFQIYLAGMNNPSHRDFAFFGTDRIGKNTRG
jgi:hypothetical protein